MKIHNIEDSKTSSLGLEDSMVVEHRMSENSVNLQMLMLRTGLYSDKIGAVCREYLTNARDAHKESKTKRAIEVTIPNRFGDDVIIRDYGPGMTPEFIKNVYVSYAESTKRNSDESTGMWGLGSKCAYAYADSFQVVSYVDGTKYVWLAQSRPDGSGNFTLVSTTKTEEENGIAICVSLKTSTDAPTFSKKMHYYASFIDCPVTVNGVAASEHSEISYKHRKKINEDLTYGFLTLNSNRYGYSSNVIFVQGGVPYSLDWSLFETGYLEQHDASDIKKKITKLSSYYFGHYLCIEVPLGTFMPDISRENIQLNADGSTLLSFLRTVQQVFSDIDQTIATAIEKLNLSPWGEYQMRQGEKVTFGGEGVSEEEKMTLMFLYKNFSSKKKIIRNGNFMSSSIEANWSVADMRCATLDSGCESSNTSATTSGSMPWYLSRSNVAVCLYGTRHKLKQRLTAISKDTAVWKSVFGPLPHSRYHVLLVKADDNQTADEYRKWFTQRQIDKSSIGIGYDIDNTIVFRLDDHSPRISATRTNKGRRATKFARVTRLDHYVSHNSLDVHSRPITMQELLADDDDRPQAYMVTFRNKLVVDPESFDGTCDYTSGSFDSIANLLVRHLSGSIQFNAITYSEWKKNLSLTRNKIDFDSMLSFVDLVNDTQKVFSRMKEANAFENMWSSFPMSSLDKSFQEQVAQGIKELSPKTDYLLKKIIDEEAWDKFEEKHLSDSQFSDEVEQKVDASLGFLMTMYPRIKPSIGWALQNAYHYSSSSKDNTKRVGSLIKDCPWVLNQ